MTTTIPQYLEEPKVNGATYGRLILRNGHYVVTDAEPVVREFVKRVFPSAAGRAAQDLKFPATRRGIGDLNWLMMRYPLKISNKTQYEQDREFAINHALKRAANEDLQSIDISTNFKGELFEFQNIGANFLIHNERAVLADEMGLGKTVTALAAIATANEFPVLIVVPTSVQIQWQRQVGAFLEYGDMLLDDSTGESMAHIMKGLTPYDLPDRRIYIIHYGLLRGWKKTLMEMNPRTVIFDEIQELRKTGTQKYSVASLVAQHARKVWGLSGTPIYNYGDEMWSIMNIVDFHCLGDYESFTREWCRGYGDKIVKEPKVLNDHMLREGLLLRRRKEEVQSELPPKRRIVTNIDKDESTYRQMMQEAIKLAKGYHKITEWHEKGQAGREIENRTRQATGIAKAPFVATFVESLIEAGERPLVFAWHHGVHDILLDRLAEHRPVEITGRISPAKKDENVTKFDDGRSRVAVISLRSTAGLDRLQGAGTCVVFAELDWSPAIHAQCEDRLHRMGFESEESLLCYYLVADAGLDEAMQDVLGLKVGQFVGLMGDKAETEEDRMMAQKDAQSHLEKVIEKLGGK